MNCGDAPRIAGAFFECHKILYRRELGEHFRGDVVGIADGIVVNHDRQACRLGSGDEMSERLARIAAIEHSRHEHEPIYPKLLDVLHISARLGSAAFGHAAQHGHSSFDGGHHCPDELALFVGNQRLVFTQRAEKDQAGDARLD